MFTNSFLVPQIARVDESLRSLGFLGVEKTELDVKLSAGFLGNPHHLPGVAEGAGHRLFAVAVPPGAHDGDGDRRVHVVVEADVHCVQLLLRQHPPDMGVPAGDPEPFAHIVESFLVDVADGGDLGLGDGLIIPEMGFADDAVSDHGDADLVF